METLRVSSATTTETRKKSAFGFLTTFINVTIEFFYLFGHENMVKAGQKDPPSGKTTEHAANTYILADYFLTDKQIIPLFCYNNSMCGAYSLSTDFGKLARRFKAKPPKVSYPKRYNIRPSQPLVASLNTDPEQMVLAEWGIAPFWDKTGKKQEYGRKALKIRKRSSLPRIQIKSLTRSITACQQY